MRGRWRLAALSFAVALLPVASTSDLAAAGSPAAAAPAGAVEVTAQGAYRFQGWGTSLAWWANVAGGWRSARQIDDAFFGLPDREHPDRLGLNVVRYDIGASPVLWCVPDPQPSGCGAEPSRQRPLPVADLGRLPACRTFRPGAAMPAAAGGPGQPPDLAGDRNQVAVLRAALARQPPGSFVLEAFANSPPWWMTVSGCPQGNPEAADARDNLSADSYGAYGEYLASVLAAFRERGIAFDTLAPLNEPENPWGQVDNPYTGQPFCTASCQEGMHFGPEPPLRQAPAMVPLLAQVCDRLAAHGLRTTVSFPDGFNPSDTRALVALAGALPACVGQLGTHMYDFTFPNGVAPYGSGISIYDPAGTSGGRKDLAAQAVALSKRLWMSEFGTGGASGIASGLTYSSMIAADIRWLRPSAWVNWQAVEAGGGWGLFESPTWPREGPVTRTKRFSALEQYARFIRPGYQVLTALDPLDDPVHETAATMAAVDDLRRPGRVVIVGTNSGAAARHVVYDLASLGVRDPSDRATVTRYRTSATEDVRRLGSTSPVAATFSDDQPAGSITTYVVDLDRG
jgi:O-glycosyl hydrolase